MSALPDVDITTNGPVRVGITGEDGWWPHQPRDVVRVQAPDLRRVAAATAAVREAQPRVSVLVDIYVAIAGDAHIARTVLAATGGAGAAQSLLYVGTPTGLAGLITDIHALGLADGAVLIPLLPGVGELIAGEVMPALRSLGAVWERRPA